jgi:hypothetical protein
MPNSQNDNVAIIDAIADLVGISGCNFAQWAIGNGPAAIREMNKAFSSRYNFRSDLFGSMRIELPDILANGLKVSESWFSPNNFGQGILETVSESTYETVS